MKKKSPPYAIIGAVVLGVIAMFAYFSHEKALKEAEDAALAKQRADLQAEIDAANAAKAPAPVIEQPTNMRPVLYATQPIDPGVRISPNFFEKKLTPIDILPGAYTDKDDIVGWFATRNIEKGDPLTPSNIGKELPFMSGRISPGMRLLALPIFNSDINDTGGFIVDGDKVDLLYTTGASTQMVMQNVNVLYVPGPPIKTEKTAGVNPVPTPGASISVAFEVTPEQAQALIYLAQNPSGKFSMLLRARRDTGETKIKPFNGEDYADNLKKIQRTTDASIQRVQDLQKEIEEQEKNQGQGNTNAPPTPPSP